MSEGLYRLEAKLDDLGRPAWIALMVVSFILFWPLGLAILGFMIWSGRMACGRHGDVSRWQSRMAERWERRRERWGFTASGERAQRRYPGPTSGNTAFDDYREETLRRLEDEQREFDDFLARLRQAKDREEFEAFMRQRRSGTPPATSPPPPTPPQQPSSG